MLRCSRIAAVTLCIVFAAGAFAQDAREALGPQDHAAAKREPHPLEALITSLHSQLKPELKGVHPRVFFTASEVDQLRVRAHGNERDVWQRVLQNARALQSDPPPPPAEERRAQNDVAIAIAEASFVYAIERDPKYLAAAKRYMDAAVGYKIWGYSFNKPDVDLAAGHLLYGMSMGYDLLYSDLSELERVRYRDCIARHAQILADYYRPKPGRTFSYSQNHVFIPIAGLGIAAYALYDEVPAAAHWAALARAIYDRVLATYSADGYYYEGFEYYVFSTPWIIHYLDAHAHATGEDLFDQPGLRNLYLYAAHVELPGGNDPFDFGDVFEGPLTRQKQGGEYERTHPGGHLHSNYNLIYRLAARFHSPEAQGVAEYLRSLGNVNAEDFWTIAWRDPTLVAQPIKTIQPWHYFPDHEVVFWRSGWDAGATAFAFKCGPPEGHHTADLLKRFPDWHLSSGHAHPDANSFIVFAGRRYITGDSGYAGVPLTIHHNTVLVNGHGQGAEGTGHDAFEGMSYDQMNGIRIAEAKLTPTSAYVRGEAAAAYGAPLGLVRFTREFRYQNGNFTVHDSLEANKPRIFTAVFHADGNIRKIGEDAWSFDSYGKPAELLIKAPAGTTGSVALNDVTAPGAPGSVDKGEQQIRGTRLMVTSPPASRTEFDFEFVPHPRSLPESH